MLALKDLAKMNEEQRERAFEELRAKPNGDALRSRIRDLETRYEMTSTAMLAKWRAGTLSDTHDISRWLVLLRAAGVR